MKILLAVERFDYGLQSRGPSFAFQSLRHPLQRLGHDVVDFDTMDPAWSNPADAGSALSEAVDSSRPDFVLCMLMNDELPLDAIEAIGRRTVTANWFPDDVWRFRTFSRRVAPSFHWSFTTSRAAHAKYEQLGLRCLFLPWGHNSVPVPLSLADTKYDVAFVGQRHGGRGALVDRLRSDGVHIDAWGTGWESGRLSPEEMASVFASARVNLSFLECSAGQFQSLGLRGGWRADKALRRVFPGRPQLKARPFEIAASGGFLLSESMAELEECFVPDREFGRFSDYSSLRASIRRWLLDDELRRAIAQAGTERAVREHSYESRFRFAFEAMRLVASS